MLKMFEVRSLGGVNFIRLDKILALQTSPTGQTVVMLEGGVAIQSSEKPSDIAGRIAALDTTP